MRKPLILWLLVLLASATMLQAAEPQVGEPLEPEMGNYIELSNGLTANIRIEDQEPRVYFLDAEGKLVAPPFARGFLFIERTLGDGDIRILMHSEGAFMTSKRKVYKPHRFRVRMVLYETEDSEHGKVSIPIQLYKDPSAK